MTATNIGIGLNARLDILSTADIMNKRVLKNKAAVRAKLPSLDSRFGRDNGGVGTRGKQRSSRLHQIDFAYSLD